MQTGTLENCTVAELTQVFNLAFSDYIVPLQLTEEAMKDKMKTENIQLPLSAGAFEDGQLVGFILHGYDLVDQVPTVYNAGTGVIPSHRGRSITATLYQFIIPRLQERQIHHHVLEVISTNAPAIKVYEKLGFSRQRELGVFKTDKMIDAPANISIKERKSTGNLLTAFSSCQPSWQNNLSSIYRNAEGHKFLAAFNGNEEVACAVYVPATGRVKQLAVHPQHRRKGYGRALVSYMMRSKCAGALVFTNVDLAYLPAISFLHHLGFDRLLTQFEMKMVR
jgi:ribosomal protein S18 acetylase RimI-like enzyme